MTMARNFYISVVPETGLSLMLSLGLVGINSREMAMLVTAWNTDTHNVIPAQ
jgi:hypothetical protein